MKRREWKDQSTANSRNIENFLYILLSPQNKLQRFIDTLLFFITAFNVHAQDCDKFRTGTFEYETHGLGMFIVKRDATHQWMYMPNKMFDVKGSIEWVSDCKYVLTYESSTGTQFDLTGIVGTQEYCEIIKTTDDGYTCEVTDSGGEVQAMQLYIVKD